jgi:hypothetical protein
VQCLHTHTHTFTQAGNLLPRQPRRTKVVPHRLRQIQSVLYEHISNRWEVGFKFAVSDGAFQHVTHFIRKLYIYDQTSMVAHTSTTLGHRGPDCNSAKNLITAISKKNKAGAIKRVGDPLFLRSAPAAPFGLGSPFPFLFSADRSLSLTGAQGLNSLANTRTLRLTARPRRL